MQYLGEQLEPRQFHNKADESVCCCMPCGGQLVCWIFKKNVHQHVWIMKIKQVNYTRRIKKLLPVEKTAFEDLYVLRWADYYKKHQCPFFPSDVGLRERDTSVNALETFHRGNDTLSSGLCRPLNAKSTTVVQNKLKLRENVEILSVQVISRNTFRLCSPFCGQRTPSVWYVIHTHTHTL